MDPGWRDLRRCVGSILYRMVEAMNRILTASLEFVDKAAVIRRLVLALSCWMTWDAYRWAAQFATYTDKAGVETAAMIAAVTAPVSWITVAVFKTYTEGNV